VRLKVSLPFSEYRQRISGVSLGRAYQYVEVKCLALLEMADIPPPIRGPGLHQLVQEIIYDLLEIDGVVDTKDFFITVGYIEFDNESDMLVYKMKHGERFKITIL
jgi:hypothetical protein